MTALAAGGASPGAAPSPALAPPPGNPRFPLFDSLRGLAVLAVMAFHVTAVTGALGRPVAGDAAAVLGALGPILFFVISGFLLYRPYVAARAGGRPAPGTARYARRRALRILPAYWVALTALAVFPGVAGVFTGDWWRYYLFLQLYSEDTLAKGIPVAWTLCVEVSFYLCLPLWALAVRRLAPGPRLRGELAALALVALAGAAVQVAAARLEVSHLVASALPGQATWLALGMALAVVSVGAARPGREPRAARLLAERPGWCWIGAAVAFCGLVALAPGGGLLGLVAALTTPQPLAETLARIALTGVVCALLVVPAVFGAAAGGVPRRVLRAAPLVWIGVISYGLYIWHLTVAELLALPADPAHFSADGLGLAAHVHRATTPILFVLTFAVSAALALASYRLVELPFLRRKER